MKEDREGGERVKEMGQWDHRDEMGREFIYSRNGSAATQDLASGHTRLGSHQLSTARSLPREIDDHLAISQAFRASWKGHPGMRDPSLWLQRETVNGSGQPPWPPRAAVEEGRTGYVWVTFQ